MDPTLEKLGWNCKTKIVDPSQEKFECGIFSFFFLVIQKYCAKHIFENTFFGLCFSFLNLLYTKISLLENNCQINFWFSKLLKKLLFKISSENTKLKAFTKHTQQSLNIRTSAYQKTRKIYFKWIKLYQKLNKYYLIFKYKKMSNLKL